MSDHRIEIRDLEDPRLELYTKYSEVQLSHLRSPKPGYFIAESPKVIQRALEAGYQPVSMLMETQHVDGEAKEVIAAAGEIPIFTAEWEVLSKLTGYPMTRGALCAFERRQSPAAAEICAGAKRIAVLENVVNPTNIGAIFRSAAALHMDAVLLTPGCCDPLYRRSARVSMGTVFQVPWTYIGRKQKEWDERGIELLRELGFRSAAMALTDRCVSIDDPGVCEEERLAILLGNEGDGLHEKTIEESDYTIKIPMSHGVDSLNVAAASAVAFWQLGNRPD